MKLITQHFFQICKIFSIVVNQICVISVLCFVALAEYTVGLDSVEMYLFRGRDRRRVLPGRTCDTNARRCKSSRFSRVRLWALKARSERRNWTELN